MMHGGPGSAHQVDLQEQKVTTHVSPNLSKLVRNCALPQTFENQPLGHFLDRVAAQGLEERGCRHRQCIWSKKRLLFLAGNHRRSG